MRPHPDPALTTDPHSLDPILKACDHCALPDPEGVRLIRLHNVTSIQ
jgi:hypothetical protein